MGNGGGSSFAKSPYLLVGPAAQIFGTAGAVSLLLLEAFLDPVHVLLTDPNPPCAAPKSRVLEHALLCLLKCLGRWAESVILSQSVGVELLLRWNMFSLKLPTHRRTLMEST